MQSLIIDLTLLGLEYFACLTYWFSSKLAFGRKPLVLFHTRLLSPLLNFLFGGSKKTISELGVMYPPVVLTCRNIWNSLNSIY